MEREGVPKPGVTTRAKVVRVLDGDMVDVELRLPVRIRLTDCWAPEIRGDDRTAGQRAKRELAEMLPRGRNILVHVPTQTARQFGDILTFGRVLGSIWATFKGKGKRNVSAEMVARGFATREKHG